MNYYFVRNFFFVVKLVVVSIFILICFKLTFFFQIFGKFVKMVDRVKKGAIGKIWQEVSDEDKLQFSRIAVDVNLDYREIE